MLKGPSQNGGKRYVPRADIEAKQSLRLWSSSQKRTETKPPLYRMSLVITHCLLTLVRVISFFLKFLVCTSSICFFLCVLTGIQLFNRRGQKNILLAQSKKQSKAQHGNLGRKVVIVAGSGGPTPANIYIFYLFQNPTSLHAK